MRHRVRFSLFAAVISAAIGYAVDQATSTNAPNSPANARSTGPIELQPTAIGPVHFGSAEAAATAGLTVLLGRSLGAAQRYNEGGCGNYDLLQWPSVQVFFMADRLVGYNVGSSSQRHGISFRTARDLTLGDTVATAQRLYGAAFVTSSMQGGSWSATTTTGKLIGSLMNPPIQAGPSDRITDISAGYVGCPAMTP